MIHGYLSINNVISKLYRDLDINEEINESHLIEWCAEALDKIDTYAQ